MFRLHDAADVVYAHLFGAQIRKFRLIKIT